MPNGGMMPSCFVCKWGKKDTSRPIHPQHNNPLVEPLQCQRHGFAVWLPSSHVCADLTDSHDGTAFLTFAKQEGLEGDNIYAWLEFAYRPSKQAQVPLYHHELVKLASFDEYSRWSLEEKQAAFQQARDRKEQEWQNNSDLAGN